MHNINIYDIIILCFLFGTATVPALVVFYIVKKLKKKKKTAVIQSLSVFFSIWLTYLVLYSVSDVSNSIAIKNYYSKDIYISKVYIGRKVIFQGQYILTPSDKSRFSLQNKELNGQYSINRIIHNKGAILTIEFNDGDYDRKASVKLVDNEKFGCVFYIVYKENKEFSAICDSLYIDPSW